MYETDIIGDIHPADIAPVLRRRGGDISLDKMRWGYPSPKGSGLIINARIETIDEKLMFKQDILQRRCVIPAAAFYEWDRDKQKALIELPQHEICYLAGIYRMYEDMEHFTVITTEANESMRRIHDRMPLLIKEEDIFSWMGDGFRNVMSLEMPELDIHIENEQLSFL